jgi:hypothetical protein
MTAKARIVQKQPKRAGPNLSLAYVFMAIHP